MRTECGPVPLTLLRPGNVTRSADLFLDLLLGHERHVANLSLFTPHRGERVVRRGPCGPADSRGHANLRENRMETVHIFVSTGRFRSLEELRSFVDLAYTSDGDGIPSPFMREVDLADYDPACIEATHAEEPKPLALLLEHASYADQWLSHVDAGRVANSAICVFAPNRVRRPRQTSLEYVGSYTYHVR